MIRKISLVAFTLASIAFAGAACTGGGGGGDDDDDDGATSATPTPTYVPVTMNFVKGPAIAAPVAGAVGTPVDGRYLLSPETGTGNVKWVELRGFDADGAPYIFLEPIGCDITYDRTAAALTQVGTCNFMAPPGDWYRVTLNVDGVFTIGIRDGGRNIFTDAAGITFTDPGAMTPYTLDTGIETHAYDTYAIHPFVVPTAGTPTLTVAVDMAHTVYLEKAGAGTLESFVPFRFSDPLPPLVDKIQYYNVTGTAGTASAAGIADQDDDSLRVYWHGSQPVYLQYYDPAGTASLGSWAAAPEALGTTQGHSTGGYAGVAGGTLCWAMASTYDAWDGAGRICSMTVPANVGDAATINCDDVATIPAPNSGATYASGCPAITPDHTAVVRLVSQ